MKAENVATLESLSQRNNELEAMVQTLSRRFERISRGVPFHVHRCVGVLPYHEWECDSPYCLQIQTDCKEHGGPGAVPPPSR